MSDSTSSFSQECELNKNMSAAGPTSTLICICCLKNQIPCINLRTCSHAEFLNNFVMPELKVEDQVICHQCHNMLKRIKMFKLQVEESFKLLSDSVDNVSKSGQQDYKLQKHLVFTIDIPSTLKKRKPQTNETENLQAKRKKSKADIDNLITLELPKTNYTQKPQTDEPNMGVENSFLPNSIKKTKNIEDALKIINNNQNSGCIDLLASSLKTISYSLLSNINNINFDIGNQISRNPTDMLFSNNTANNPTNSENIFNNTIENNNTNLDIENEIGRKPTAMFLINNTPTTANNPTHMSRENIIFNNSTENNNSNLVLENQIGINPTDILFSTKNATPICSGNITINNTTENNRTDLAVGNQLHAPTDALYNISTPTNKASPVSSDNITSNNSTENNNTNLDIGNEISRNPTDILLNNNAPTNNSTSVPSRNISTNNTTGNYDITISHKIIKNNTDIVEHVVNEKLNPEKDECMDGGPSNMQTDEPTMKKRPPVGFKIKQVTLTREQLTEERSKMASSQTFLRLPHRCETCLVGFQFKENLDDHVLRKHTGDKIRNPEKCDVCLQFVEACNYDKHLFWHLTRYKCVSCSQQFDSVDKASQHYRKHHRRYKPRALFKCAHCPYKTRYMCWLKRHVRRVTKCETCGDRISQGCGASISLNRHTARCKRPNELKPDQNRDPI